MLKKVSVVMTVLNEKASIKSIIEQLLQQTRKPDEIVIVDGGSTDGTVKIIEDIISREKCIRLLIHDGANISQGRNIAIENASNELIAVIDGGCIPESNWLEMMVFPFKNDFSLDAVKGVYKSAPKTTFEYISGLLHIAGGLLDINEDQYPLSGRCSAFTKVIWKKAGGYPEWLYTAEDTLFHKKLKKLGARMKLAKEAIIFWRPRKDLKHLAKMYYLYGKGEGRIGKKPSGAIYNLRNYLIFTILLFLTIAFPLMAPILAIYSVYFFKNYYLQPIKRVQTVFRSWKIFLYIPMILTVRQISHSMGLLRGSYEFRTNSLYKKNLEKYLEIHAQ